MTDSYYLDANALRSWGFAKTASAPVRDKTIGLRVETLVEGSDVTATSEIALAEFQTGVCNMLRSGKQAECDEAWSQDVQVRLMRWIIDGKLRILPLPPRLLEKAMDYVVFATRERNRNLGAWDAAHLHQACEWSREIGTKVKLVTSDGDFSIVRDFPEFDEFVELIDPAV